MNFLEPVDDTDMFFLSMSRMTKQLPQIEQAKIKLELSNSVLSVEVRYNQQQQPLPVSTPYSHNTPSPASSTSYQMVSPSDECSHGGNYTAMENFRPTLLQLTSLSPSQYNEF
ncbi:hypothetical protein HHI36_002428 [Cryptolaemus montrouzieri]|uniref:BESS domain-containing protein n=1 Tax=Cryptolaemus montrouzieri TaxID=559131 RepID=A0ABD2PB16_9CUCU